MKIVDCRWHKSWAPKPNSKPKLKLKVTVAFSASVPVKVQPKDGWGGNWNFGKVILTFNGQTARKTVHSALCCSDPGLVSVLSAAKSAAECVVADKINIITTGNGKNHVQKAQSVAQLLQVG